MAKSICISGEAMPSSCQIIFLVVFLPSLLLMVFPMFDWKVRLFLLNKLLNIKLLSECLNLRMSVCDKLNNSFEFMSFNDNQWSN